MAGSAPARSSSASRRLVGLLGALALVGACAEDTGAPTPAGTARILSVVDGDTVVVRVEGASETVRLIGIDTPETNHPTRPVECYGAEATAVATELVPPGTTVRLERDVEPRDRFGRLLAYVHRTADGLFVNLALVERGAAVANAYPPNLARQRDLDAADRRARAAGLGLWGQCGGPGVPLDPLAPAPAGPVG